MVKGVIKMRVVDMHCDTILELLSRDLKGKEASCIQMICRLIWKK